MTSYDIAVPAIALTLGVAAVLYAKWASSRLDDRLRERTRRQHAGD